MGQTALAILPASATKWTVLTGPMQGTVRLMNVPLFYVGRSSECELVIVQDPKCSRKHAQIESVGHGCEVLSLNEKNLVMVNGREVERAELQDGDIVTFGDTQIQYNMTVTHAGGGSQVALMPPLESLAPATPAAAPAQVRAQPRPIPRSARQPGPQKSKTTFYIVLGVVGLMLYLLLTPSAAKKKAAEIRNQQQIENDIEAAKKMREAAVQQSLRKMDQTVMARQAQENFVRGFRDYKKGQYERALSSFQACLALNPDHILCNRYIRLGQRKFDELVQYQMVLGRKYRDQNQFKACRSSFRNVMVMIKDVNSKVFQEAKANYDACDALVEGNF